MSPTGRTPAFWERSVPWWHGVLVAIIAVVTLVVLVDPAVADGRWRALAALAATGVAYAVAGRRALGTGGLAQALAYLVTAWAGFVVLVQLTPAAYLLLLAYFPQSWAMLPSRRAAVTWNVLTVVVFAGVQVRGGEQVGAALVTAVIQLSLSLLLGLWTSGLIDESIRRAELITELERTRAELAETQHARGALAERERLAGEIHDTLAQGLASILALAQAVDAALERDPDRARARLELLEATARDNLAESRALVAALGPVDLESATVSQALTRLAERFGAETGIPVHVEVTGEPGAQRSANADVVLVRAAQEALANVRRHSGASSVTLRLALGPEGTELTVVDDGRGFAPDAPAGYGLAGMRARAMQVGGAVQVSSAPGAGTTVRVNVP